MELKPAASRVSAAGPADWFTGQVWMDELGCCPGRESSTGTAPRRIS